MSATLTEARLSDQPDGHWSVWGADLFNNL